MTETIVSAPERTDVVRGGAFYRLVWKWHFLASLYVLPFMLMLSITGGVYLFKPQIEEVLYADRLNIEATGTPLALEAQEEAVRTAFPEARIKEIITENEANRSTLFVIQSPEKVKSYVWFNPYTGEILADQTRSSTAMRLLKKFHGELLLGKTGTKLVELAAHWAIVMLITGLYLWWPRGKRSLSKALSLPSGKGRSWWRETHMYTGFLAFILIFPLLLSGLPWTDIWGGSFKYVQTELGQRPASLRPGKDNTESVPNGNATISYQAAVDIAVAQGMALPIMVQPPKGETGVYYLKTKSRERLARSEIIVDQYSGEVLNRMDISAYPFMAKLVSYGIGFHQGELYGTLNLVQNVIASLLGVMLSVTGFIAWWKRRPKGELGVPVAPTAKLGMGMGALVIFLAILFPLVGASLIVVLLLDWLIFKKIGWFQGPATS